MKRFLPIVICLAILLISCGTQEQRAQPRHDIDKRGDRPRSTVGKPPLGHRFVVLGDFDGNGIIDTLVEHLVDRRSGVETSRYREGEEYEQSVMRLARERPLCFIASTDRSIDSIPLAADYPASGLAFMRNEGDLGGNGTDELSYVVDHLDMSSVNTCTGVTLTPDGWQDVLQFEIREWQIPQLQGEAKSYGFFGLQDAVHGAHDDSITSIIRRALDRFSFIEPIRPGLVRISTFADEDSDSVAIGESVTKIVALRSSRQGSSGSRKVK